MLPSPNYKNLKNQSSKACLATLLFCCFKHVSLIDGGDFGPWLRKISPSGGARHPTEALITLSNVADLANGTYYYDPQTHALIPADISLLANSTNASETIILTFFARIERSMWRYREARALRPLIIDIGHVIGSLNELALKFGWQLREVFPQQELNFNEPAFISFSLTKANTDLCTQSRTKPSDCDHKKQYKTNPFLWLYFSNGEIIGNINYPITKQLVLRNEEIHLLSYTQPSKRGDRASTPGELLQLFKNISQKRLSKLIENEFLLSLDRHHAITSKMRQWIDFGWYQSLLAYACYKQALSQTQPKQLTIEATQILPPSIQTSWQILSQHRHTTRSFSQTRPFCPNKLQILTKALTSSTQLLEGNIDLFRLILNTGTLSFYDKSANKFSKIANSVTRSQLVEASIGQLPIGDCACVYWLVTNQPASDSINYLRQFLRLGIIMQRLCMKAAELNSGIFISPAVNDTKTTQLLQLTPQTHPIYYIAAIGEKYIFA